MNNLSTEEAAFLGNITPMLNENANRQTIINMVRKMVKSAKNTGFNQGRNGWQKDHTWTDDQLK